MKEYLLSIFRKLQFILGRFKRLLVIIFIILAVIFLIYYIFKLIEPTANSYSVFISNISDHQATVSWVTDKDTRGSLIVSEDNKFPVLPIFAKKVYRDNAKDIGGKDNFQTVHQITIDSLAPDKTYYYMIFYEWKKVVYGSFKTGSALESINGPRPVYGTVVSGDGKTPVKGVLVYLKVETGKMTSSLLSTLTNAEGRWSLDLGNLRSSDLKLNYQISSKSAEKIIVEGGRLGRVKAESVPGKDNPWPTIILK